MATFLDYIDLRLGVSEWVDRRDISDILPRFVAAAEVNINGFLRCRQMLVIGSTLTFTAGLAPLPTDFLEVRTIWDATNKIPLEGTSTTQVLQGTSDIYAFAIVNSNVFIDGLTGTRLMDYYQALPTLLTSLTTSNWLLQAAPNLYLYAVCYEVAKWMKDKTLADAAEKLMNDELLTLHQSNARAIYGSTSVRMRSPTP